MSKTRGVLLIVLLAVALLVTSLLRPRGEPAYKGKPLTAWLKDLERWSGDTNDEAIVAFREMGTNAIPALLKVIQSGGPPLQKMILKLNRKQHTIDLPFGTPWHQTGAASWALYAMGTNARPALPVLTDLLFHTNGLIITSRALAGIGSEAVPVLLSALTNQNYRIRHSAASGLGWERSDFDLVVPALIAALSDGSSTVHRAAVISLGQLHANPELAVPALMKDFPGNDTLLRQIILSALSEFEGKAKEAVPLILSALKDTNESVRESAGFALKHIDPEAAAKARVE